MLNKLITTAGFVCLVQNGRAQEEESLATIPSGAIPDGALGAEAGVDEEITESAVTNGGMADQEA